MTPPDHSANQTRDRAENDPDHPDKPDSPGELTKRSWLFVLRKTAREFSNDQCTDIAAALTYYAVQALFPALIALLSIIGLTGKSHQQQTVKTLTTLLQDAGASSMTHTLQPVIKHLASSNKAGLALIIGIVAALWSASGYTGAFGRALNRMYEVGEGRPFWKLRPAMLVLTAVLLVLAAAVLLGLVVSGPVAQAVGNALHIGSTALTVWNIAKWPVILIVVVIMVALLYWGTPNVRQPKLRWISVGSLLAIVVWIVVSLLFGFYVAHFSSYNKTYGTLAGVIVFLLWLWLTNLSLLFGAELDAELERGRELQAGIAAEEEVQLPPRDTKNIEKKQRQHEKDVAKGRALRTSHGEDDSDTHDNS